MLAVDLGRFLELIERLGSDVAVVSQLLELEHASIGGKANLAQRRVVFEASPLHLMNWSCSPRLCGESHPMTATVSD